MASDAFISLAAPQSLDSGAATGGICPVCSSGYT